jgi:predicted esterase
VLFSLIAGCFFNGSAVAEQAFQLRNGMVLLGSKAEIATLKEGFGAAAAAQVNVRPIWLIDDGLRRQYIHGKSMVAAPPVQQPNLTQSIEIWQPKPLGGKIVSGLGNILAISPFNEFARRQLRMQGPQGPVHVIQGIQELNPRYARLIALKPAAGQPTLLWDMRVATSSLSSSVLDQIFANRIDQTDLNGRLEIVRFYIAAERFGDAKAALEATIADFPDEKDLEKQLIALTQRQASQLLDEAEKRAGVGQYQLAKGILDNFPTEDVGRITRLQVQDARNELQQKEDEAKQIVGQLRKQISELPEGQATKIKTIVDEIDNGLSADTLVRLSDYARLKDAESIAVEDRVALAISGWLMGSGSGVQNLSIAAALVQVRDLVAEYLSGVDAARREAILTTLKNLEGALPEYVDRIFPLLKPTMPWPEGSEHETIEGFHRIETEQTKYLVQLPPEYNPLRPYPCVVALHAAGGDPNDQIDWWSGIYHSETQSRLGHAARNGFVVIAPLWSRDTQRSYEYTPAEHERVLTAMRDAMRRCSIDSDRVFIAGHGEGATAAWDISLAHPDLWAGLISISANPDKTIHHYEPNARFVPMYLVMGELDGNVDAGASAILDDYMSFHHDAMVVMYRGRGREFFYDEIPRLFEWMNTKQHERRPIPQEFEVNTMRRGDQFFWWLELGELKPGVDINPILWDQVSRIRSGTVSGSIGTGNQIRVSSAPSDQIRIWIRPMEGVIDLAKQVVVRYGTRPSYHDFDGDLKTMLEDARQRADRKRAFWMQISLP